MTKDRDRLVNLNNVVKIERFYYVETNEERKVRYIAKTISQDYVWLGTYDDTPEHENLIEKIAETEGAINVFYMPEE